MDTVSRVQTADRNRTTEHKTFPAGQFVTVIGHKGTWRVMYIDEFVGKRRDEVTVVGGTKGHSQYRTFYVDQLKKVTRRKQADLSREGA